MRATDDVDGREAAAVRGRHPARRSRSRPSLANAPQSDWMSIEREARHLCRHLGDDLRIRRPRLQPARYAPGHEDFPNTLNTYRTLTAVDSAVMVIDAAKGISSRGRPQAVRGLPASAPRHSDHHFHQQDGPLRAAIRSTSSTRSRRRWRSIPRRSPGRSEKRRPATLPAPSMWNQAACCQRLLDGDAGEPPPRRAP